ncbi:MAG: lytic murein transglycosylase [Pseudomonadota bacterium]
MIIAFIALLSSTSVSADAEAFDAFRQSFRAEALRAGIDADVYDQEMATAEPLSIVLERDGNQPEFSRPIWSYLDSAVSDRRIADGRTAVSDARVTLEVIADEYGVDSEIIAAIWGLESNYGTILGTHDIVSALATLGYTGRRQSFGREQLIAALQILNASYADRSQLKGSWAGAMGQTQFIPTTYLAYAVDHNQDGKRDLWGDLEDVFASTANYLKKSGYQDGEPWGIEVTLPDDFNYALSDGRRQSVVEWILAGVRGADAALPDEVDLDASAKLLVPAGARGPAFLTFKNYDTILAYNRSTAYALGVALLSERLAGADQGLMQSWPRDDRPLSRDERKELQRALADQGYTVGPIDGIIGAQTRRALRAWQASNNLPADGYASAFVLDQLAAE